MSADPIINNRGFLEVSLTVAKNNPAVLLRVQSKIAIHDVSINHVTDTIRFYGTSPLFDPIEPHQIAPAYDWHLAPGDSITYSKR